MIFLDMDGVIANFVSSAIKATDNPLTEEQVNGYDFYTAAGMTESQFWEAIEAKGQDFWENLEPYPWATELIRVVEEFDPEFQIVTIPCRTGDCIMGKVAWLIKHFGPEYARKIHFATRKEGKARYIRNSGDILIDDTPRNIEQWQSGGGRGFLFPQPWNSHVPVRHSFNLISQVREFLQKNTGVEDILDEAKRITSTDRQNSYGPPDQDFNRTATMWEPLLQTCVDDAGILRIPPRMVALCMIAMKMSRETHMHKRDSAVDIAGYARCYQICKDAETKTA